MESAYSFYLNIYEDLKKFCQPLHHYLGLSHFGYLRIFYNSNYIHISNDHNLTAAYLEKITQSQIFFDKFLFYDQSTDYQFILWPKNPIDTSMNLYLEHRYWHGFTIAKFNNHSHLEMWWFAADQESNNLENFYYQHWKILLSFVKKFNHQFIEKIDYNKLALAKYYEGFSFNIPLLNEENNCRDKIKDFINTLFPKGIEVKCKNSWERITQREIHCLSILAQGKTMKEISNELSLSPRTIETHLQHLQNKTGYHLRSDLVKLYNQEIKHLFFK